MSSSTSARTILDGFAPAALARSVRHPERASTACPCRSPEPCWEHPAPAPATAPMPAIRAVPDPVLDAAPPGVPYGDYLAQRDLEAAPSVCQCSAPEPCRVHPDDAPLVRRAPAWNEPHPESPVARTRRRLEHDRAVGVLPGSIDGKGGADVLPLLTDHELGAWTQALLAEHHRRQQRFLDYRTGAESARIRDDARRLA